MPRGRKKGEGAGVRAVAWEEAFLAALGRTGNVRASAEAAGVDVTAAYNRRQRCAEFREAWARVLCEREARASGAAGGGFALTPLASGESPSPGTGEGYVARSTATGVKLARVGTARWSGKAQARFLAELAASANVKRAAAAAGFSPEAVYKRRLKTPAFGQAWDAAIEVGKARLKAMLVEAAANSFDPDALPVDGEPARHVSVGEAIHILRLKSGEGSLAAVPPAAGSSIASCGCDMSEEGIAEVKARIIAKLLRLREQDSEGRLAEGWVMDGEHWIPPGWVRAEP